MATNSRSDIQSRNLQNTIVRRSFWTSQNEAHTQKEGGCLFGLDLRNELVQNNDEEATPEHYVTANHSNHATQS